MEKAEETENTSEEEKNYKQRKTSLFESVKQPHNEAHDKGTFVITHADFPKGKPRSWTFPGKNSQKDQNEV